MLGQLWAAQWMELVCSADKFWTSLLSAALCHHRLLRDSSLQGSVKSRIPFGQSAFPSQPLEPAPASSCAAVWGEEWGAEGAEAAFPFPLCPGNNTHLHMLPLKVMKGFRPQLNNSQPSTGGKQEALFHPKNIIFFQMGSCSAVMQALGGQWIFI